ncbi:hypothetical protein OE855_002595 [Salmonella enterica subsp. enterica serovar Schwarzengrund]|nr:hypothetical protein [Salmonella enterica subsp. enterica serovar Schwarzengrund]
MKHIEWLESMHTLHGAIEILYVVDGYQIQRTYDDVEIGVPIKADTLAQCIDTAIEKCWEPLTSRNVNNYSIGEQP